MHKMRIISLVTAGVIFFTGTTSAIRADAYGESLSIGNQESVDTDFKEPAALDAGEAVGKNILEQNVELLSSGVQSETVKVGDYNISDSLGLYSKFDYSDPQHIPDALLFGKWDEAKNAWIPQDNPVVIKNNLVYPKQNNKPLIDYSADENLAKVEKAVKECNGNYNKPKALLLQYYQNKFKQINKDVTVSGTKDSTVLANALAYNFIPAGIKPLDLFDLQHQEKYYEFDVTSEIANIVSNTGVKQYSFILTALQIDGATGSLYASESENKPYVTLTLTDNTTLTLYPEADVTIKGGGDSGKTFGKESKLYVSERRNAKAASDIYSKRTIVKFNFSEIKQGTRVKSAKFGICGSSDMELRPQKVMLSKLSAVSWTEDNFTWNDADLTATLSFDTYPGCSKDFYQSNYFSFTDNAVKLASRYLYDKNEMYAYHAIRYMLYYHKDIDGLPFAYNDFLAKSVNAKQLSDCLYSLIDSQYMTPEAFGMLLKSVYALTEWIVEGWNKNPGNITSNHGTYYNRGFASLITLFPEFYKANDIWIDDDGSYQGPFYGGRGGWIPCLQKRVMYKANEITFPDGAGKEVSGGYNMESFTNSVMVLQFVSETNMIHLLPEEYYDLMATAALYFMHGMAPGYYDWNVGNSWGYGNQFINRDSVKTVIDSLQLLLKNDSNPSGKLYKEREIKYQQLLYAYTDGFKGWAPEFQSILYPIARKVIMRSSWYKKAVGATMGISNGGIHSHFDDLNIVLAVYGRCLLSDQGKVAYNQDDPFRAWLISTRAHNTIEINDISQRSTLFTNSEMTPGPIGEKIVLPFRAPFDISKSGVYINDEIELPQNVHLKEILKNKDYSKENLKKIYDFDAEVATKYSTSVSNGGKLYLQGKYLESELNDVYDYVKGETYNNIGVQYKDNQGFFGEKGKTYYGLDNAHNRSMLFVKPGIFIVTDYVEPINNNHEVNKYNQTWHFPNDADITMDDKTKAVTTNYNDANLAVVPVLNSDELIASIQDGWYHLSTTIPAKYASYVKNSDKATTFNTMLIPMEPGKTYDTVTQNIELDDLENSDASAFAFVMTEKNSSKKTQGTYYNVHHSNAVKKRTVGEYMTDARMMYIDKGNAYYGSAIIADGTELQDKNGRYIVKANQNIVHLGVAWSGDKISLSTTQPIDLSTVTFLAERDIQSVYLNGNGISFKEKDGYVYFGDKPLIEGDGEEPEPDPELPPSKPPTTHGGGGKNPFVNPIQPIDPSTKDPNIEQNANQFNAELDGHWAESEIKQLIQDGVVNGISETSLGLDREVTRAEFIAMIARAFDLKPDTYNGEFADVQGTEWYAGMLAVAKKAGIIEGDSDRNASPDGRLTREEMSKIAVSALFTLSGKQDSSNSETSFQDDEQISGWARSYVSQAVGLQLMIGTADGSFKPKSVVPREQAMTVIWRMKYKN